MAGLTEKNRRILPFLGCDSFIILTMAIIPTMIPLVSTYDLTPITTVSSRTIRDHNTPSLFNDRYPFDIPFVRLHGRTELYSTPDTNKRKRRRRKDSTGGSSNDSSDDGKNNDVQTSMISSSISNNVNDNELPDFDIRDDDDNEVVGTSTSTGSTTTSTSTTSSKTMMTSTPKMSVDPLIGKITPNMMSSSSSATTTSNSPTVSINEIRDRSLEQKLESLVADDNTSDSNSNLKEELPDLLTLQRQRKQMTTEEILLSSSKMSKKERQILARQQQDIEQQQTRRVTSSDGEEESTIFSKLPLVTNEEGKIVPIKLLENATWACIILLIAWELYINSPFFNRAAPIIPVVYEIFM